MYNPLYNPTHTLHTSCPNLTIRLLMLWSLHLSEVSADDVRTYVHTAHAMPMSHQLQYCHVQTAVMFGHVQTAVMCCHVDRHIASLWIMRSEVYLYGVLVSTVDYTVSRLSRLRLAADTMTRLQWAFQLTVGLLQGCL